MKDSLIKSFTAHTQGKDVVIFWSGGFDSTFLLNFIIKNKLYVSTNITLMLVTFPQEIYLYEKIQEIKDYLERLNISLVVLTPKENIGHDYEFSKACGKCKEIRRNIIKNYLDKNLCIVNREVVFITGHNLDDLASYTLELIAHKFEKTCDPKINDRLLECSNKFYEYMPFDKAALYRPLIYWTKSQMLSMNEVAQDNIFEHITYTKCFWLNQRKRLLQRYFESAHLELNYDMIYDFFTKNLRIPEIDEFYSLPIETYFM